jgi:DNA polymerase elongation subunit (family B)
MKDLEIFVLDVDHLVEDEMPLIRIWGKTRDGKNVLAIDRSFSPYFYLDVEPDLMKTTGIDSLRKRIIQLKEMEGKEVRIEVVEKNLLGEKKSFLKITLQNPTDIPKLRHIVEDWKGIRKAYEYDITLYRRYLIDKGISPMDWVTISGEEIKGEYKVDKVLEIKEIRPSRSDRKPKLNILSLDIEMVGNEIIMVSFASKSFKKVLTYEWKEGPKRNLEIVKNEEEMIKRFVEIIQERNPNIIVTYNGDLFDFYKLRERAGHYKIPMVLGRDNTPLIYTKRGRIYSAKISGRVHVDIYNFIEKILGDSLSSETFTLDMVSKELLGTGKKPLQWDEIEKLWKEKKGLNKISAYCLWDSELTLKLSDRLLPQIFELSRLVGQTLFDTSRMTYSQLVEWLLIKNAFVRNEIALNRPKYDEIKRRREASPYTGGYVYPPEPGIHEKIALFDFASLYPSTVITHNISPETLDKDSEEAKEKNKVPGEEHFFSTKQKGFIPAIIEELVKRRMEIKRRMGSFESDSPEYRDLYNRQYALKVIANASYGYYAYAGSRWYSRICAKSIAAWGRYYIQKVIELAKERGFRVIYGDTDSLFLERCDKGKAKSFLDEVNKQLPETMELEFENTYKAGIFVPTKAGTTAKKRYALLDYNDKITIRGFEKVRRDWAKIAKDTQEKVLLAILKDRDQNKALKIVEETIERLKANEVKMEDLVIYTQITRPLGQYDQIGPHVSAAKKYVERGHTIQPDSVIGYVITKGVGSISNRAEPFEYAENYDPEYYIRNQIIPAAMRILNALGFSESDFEKEEPGQKSLDFFMKKSLKKRITEKFGRMK